MARRSRKSRGQRADTGGKPLCMQAGPHPAAGGSRGAQGADPPAPRGGRSCRLPPSAEPGPPLRARRLPGLRRPSTDLATGWFHVRLRKVTGGHVWRVRVCGHGGPGGWRGGPTSTGPGGLRLRTAMKGARTSPALKLQIRERRVTRLGNTARCPGTSDGNQAN